MWAEQNVNILLNGSHLYVTGPAPRLDALLTVRPGKENLESISTPLTP